MYKVIKRITGDKIVYMLLYQGTVLIFFCRRFVKGVSKFTGYSVGYNIECLLLQVVLFYSLFMGFVGKINVQFPFNNFYRQIFIYCKPAFCITLCFVVIL